MEYTIRPIATISSPYKSRFGIPRQAGLAPAVWCSIVFENTSYTQLLLRGIEDFSHYWVIFGFHELKRDPTAPLVAPPRLAGKRKVGALASRSPFRPNRLGQSLVHLKEVRPHSHSIELLIFGGDFLDSTPVYDLKPYLPYCDVAPDAVASWATPPTAMPVEWRPEALEGLNNLGFGQFKVAIEQTLGCDPRPGHERQKDGDPDQTWGFQFEQLNIVWKVEKATAHITSVTIRPQLP